MGEVAERAGAQVRAGVLVCSVALLGLCLWYLGGPDHADAGDLVVVIPVAALAFLASILAGVSLISRRAAPLTVSLWLFTVALSWLVLVGALLLILLWFVGQMGD